MSGIFRLPSNNYLFKKKFQKNTKKKNENKKKFDSMS
jgi:hypothetical protein